ncbi:MAG: hypothetical protein ACRD3I_12310, partial [Terriglobales bacterium]
VLGVALTLPLIFAVGELRDSGLLRGPLPPQAADPSPGRDSTRQPALTVDLPTPILARRNGPRLRAANRSAAEVANRETPKTQESVKGPEPESGNGGKADAADPGEAAARQLAKGIGDRVRKGGQSQ